MVETVIVVGLAAGYFTYLFTVTGAPQPQWLYRSIRWWSKHTPWAGKPFTCPFCMSFWFTIIFYTLKLLEVVAVNSASYPNILYKDRLEYLSHSFTYSIITNNPLVTIPAAACLSLLATVAVERLTTYFVQSPKS